MLGIGSYRDEGGRSVEGGHISQRIKDMEGKTEGHEKKHHASRSPLPLLLALCQAARNA